MGVLTEGYNIALQQYRQVLHTQEAIRSTQVKLNESLDTNKTEGTTEVKKPVAVTKPNNNKPDVDFDKLINDSVSEVKPGKTYNVGGYQITIPSLENPRVQETIRAYDIDKIITKASQKYDLPEALLYKVIETESNFRPDAVSGVGATGLMQIMPFNNEHLGISNAKDPYQNIMGGAKLLRQYLNMYDGDVKLGLAAYNAGPGNVNKYGGVPPFEETQNYIRKILGVEP